MLKTIRLLSVGFLIGIDQWLKQLALSHLLLGVPVSIIPGFQLTLALNRGIAFSQFDSAHGWGYLVLLAVICAICAGVFYMMFMAKDKALLTGWVLLSAGALSNLIDRVRYGFIIDFIDCYVSQWHWPVFNVADMLIFSGVCILGWCWCIQEKGTE